MFSWAENQNLNLPGFDSESTEMFLTQAVIELKYGLWESLDAT